MKKRCISLVLGLLIVLSVLSPALAFTDITGHWAKSDIEYLVSKGILNGYTDNTIRPENNITKAEYIKMINRTFGFTTKANISYPDVSPSSWYYDEIRIAEAAGYMFTFSGKVKADEKLTRQEAAAMFGRVLDLETSTTSRFTDASKISSWALPYIGAVSNAGIISGYTDNTFRPTDNIKRGEVARVFNNAVGNLYNTAGTYTNTVTKNATITTSGVTLKNMNIPGNLYITQGVAGGQIVLENVNVTGSIISVGSPSATVVLRGSMANVNTETKGITYNVQGSVNSLNINSAYDAANVTVAQGGKIEKLTLNASGKVEGTGTITEAVLNMSGVIMSLVPEKWTLGTGVTATIGGSIKTTSGVNGPAFADGYPSATITNVSDLGASMAEVKFKLKEPGVVFIMAVPQGSQAPTAEQVAAMQNYGYVTVAKCARVAVTDITQEYTAQLTDLFTSVSYDIYVVIGSGNGYQGYSEPVKLQPMISAFSVGYPKVYNSLQTSATLEVKLTRAATLYWAAVAKGTSAPTASQIISQQAPIGAIYGNKSILANTLDYVTLSGLANGVSNYDVYVVTRDAAGNIDPKTPQKLDITQAANTVEAIYSFSPTNGDYSVATSVTLSFAKDMLCATRRTPISFIANLGDYIVVTATDAATGTAKTITGYSLIATSNKTVAITPPTGGWPQATNFTIEIKNLINENGLTPTPNKFTFSTTGTQNIVAAPVASKASDTSVYTGEVITLTCSTPGATIIYSTDGYDPLQSPGQKQGSGERTDVTIDSPVAYQRVILKAVAKVGNTYSQVATYTYFVEKSIAMPLLQNIQGMPLAEQATVYSGDPLTLYCGETGAMIYYTLDGSIPSANSVAKRSGDSITVTDVNGTGKVTVRLMAIKRDESGVPQSSSYRTYELTVLNGTGVGITQKPSTPVITVNGNQYTSTTGTVTLPYYTQNLEITASSLNNASSTRYFYTFDGSIPTIYSTELGIVNTLQLNDLISRYATIQNVNGTSYRVLTLKVVAYNNLYNASYQQNPYSDVVTVTLYIQQFTL